MTLWLSFLAGCDTTMLPPAEAPGFTSGWSVRGRFWCWDERARECYLAEDDDRRANFAISYNPLNGRELTLDGRPVLETEAATPPEDLDLYTLLSTWTDDEVEHLDPSVVEGHPDSFLWLYPAQLARPPQQGDVSVLTMTTSSGNPLHQGTADALASTSVELVYVRPDQCRILELRVPSQLEPGEDFEVRYRVEGCKRARLYVYGVEAGTVVLPGLSPRAMEPTQWIDTELFAADLESDLQVTAPARGGYVSVWLEADDALGVPVSSPVQTVQVPVPEGEQPTGEAAHDPACLEQPYTVRQDCDGPGGTPVVQCVDVRACDEDAAMALAEELFAVDGFDPESSDEDGCDLSFSSCAGGS